MSVLNNSSRHLVESGKVASLVTLNADGSPQVSMVWIGLDGDDIVMGHLGEHQKVKNVNNDQRVALSIEAGIRNAHGLDEYLIIYGNATVQKGGAPELLQRLAHVYLGPDVRFPPIDNPPAGFVTRVTPTRVGGVGDWR